MEVWESDMVAALKRERDTLQRNLAGAFDEIYVLRAKLSDWASQRDYVERANAAEAKLAELKGKIALWERTLPNTAEHVAEVKRLREALDILRRCDTKDEIVSTGRLTALQIANARAAGTMYVEPGGGRGWVVRPSGPVPAWVGQQEAREALQQIEREVGNPSDVLLLRIRSIARAALRGGGE